MADKFFKIKKGLNIEPQAVDPSGVMGDVIVDSTGKLKVHNGSAFSEVGSGGAGSMDILATYSSDDDSSTWSTGNNVTLEGTGSIKGYWTKQDDSAPLRGTYSYMYQHHDSIDCTNDYVLSESITVPVEFQGKDIGLLLQGTYDGADDKNKLVIWDDTNNVELNATEVAYIKNSSVSTPYFKTAFIPVGVTAIKFGLQVLGADASKVFKFDSIELTRKPYAYVNQVEQFFGTFTADGDSGDANYFITIPAMTSWTRYGNTGLVSNSGIKIVFNGEGTFNGNLTINDGTPATVRIYLYDSANNLIGNIAQLVSTSASAYQQVSYSGYAKNGWYIQLSVGQNAAIDTIRFTMNFTSTSEHVQTPAKVGMETGNFFQAGSSMLDRTATLRFDISGTTSFSAADTNFVRNGITSTPNELKNSNNLLYLVDDSGNSMTKFVASKDIHLSMNVQYFGTANNAQDIYVFDASGTLMYSGAFYISNQGNNIVSNGNAVLFLKKDWYFKAEGFDVQNSGTQVRVNWTAIAAEPTFLASIPVIPPQINPVALDIDWSKIGPQYKEVSADSTFTFSGASNGQTVVLIVKNTAGVSKTMTMPTTVNVDGTATTAIAAGKYACFTFIRLNNTYFKLSVTDMS